MEWETPHGRVRGTPAEIMELMRSLGTAGGPVVAITTPPEPAPAPARPLRQVPNNDLLLADYRDAVKLGSITRDRYVRIVEDFERVIAPRNFIDATIDDARAYARMVNDVCALRQSTFLLGGGELSAVPRVRCKSGVYDWTLDVPAACNPKCSMFTRQARGAAAKLQGLQHFYAWLQSRGLVTSSVIAPVLSAEYAAVDAMDEPLKYSPPLGVVRALVRGAMEIKTPRDVAILLGLAKTGRRPDHTCNLRAVDARDLAGAFPHYDYAGPKEIVKKRDGGKTKLRGNLIAPLDAEHAAYIRDVYLPWRREKWGYHAGEGPLFPNTSMSHKPYDVEYIQRYILDPVMRHLKDNATSENEAAMWARHLEVDGRERISAGCFRHFATTAWHDLGVSDLDIDILRGDKIRGAKRHYLHLDAAKVCMKYRMHALLSSAPSVSIQQRLSG